MKITFSQVEEIFKKLPIGYYIGREVNTELSQSADTSYYNPMEDKITFAYNNVVEALESLDDSTDQDTVERIIRSILYHELSHAILTPRSLKATSYRNIVEDERIETILKDYYLNTDFKELVRAINGDPSDHYDKFDDFFFDLVRFRKGPPKLLKSLEDLLSRYKSLTCHLHGGYYGDSIDSFVKEARDYFENHKDEMDPPEDTLKDPSSQGTCTSGSGSESVEDLEDGSQDQKNSEDKDPTDLGRVSSDEDLEESEDFEDITIDPTEEAFETPGDKLAGRRRAYVKTLFKSVVDKYENRKLKEDLNLIFNRAKRADKISEAAINSYSGRFDTRSVLRDDYKYFVQGNRNGNLRGASKVHLNLFLDRSGSYYNNVQKTNELIYALNRIERSNPRFTFTIISCGHGETVEDHKTYIHRAYDGTSISREIYDIFKNVQDKNSINYNIVLYDGYADRGYNFSAFNSADTAIISDKSNKRNIDLFAPRARKIYIKQCETYAELLQDNVIKVLQSLVR